MTMKTRAVSDPSLLIALEACRALARHHGTSYYAAMRFLPPATRAATYALYGFVRRADEIVDTEETDSARARARLDAWRADWRETLATGTHPDPVLRAAAWAFREYGIDPALADSFLDAMLADTVTTRYATYEDLRGYMYGSASVVGLMLARVIGVSGPEALPYAEDLGYAMQLTNFLRDIREDYEQRGRVYLPQEDLQRFGVTEDDIAARRVTPEFKELMRFEIARARALYANADRGIPMLAPGGRTAVRLARVLYSKILDRIEDADYDVFSARRHTTRLQKLYYAAPVLLGHG